MIRLPLLPGIMVSSPMTEAEAGASGVSPVMDSAVSGAEAAAGVFWLPQPDAKANNRSIQSNNSSLFIFLSF